jgi:predicted RNA-binding protein with PUA-like domain
MAYWLFKTEPDEFSIDDLAALGGRPERWSGIRNYQARNLLRDQVAAGDEVFIYHSSCANVGIAGTAVISRAAYADPDQFDDHSKYFDAKASENNPRWFCVDVVFGTRFERVIPLAALKQQHGLENMVLLKQGRLSVQPVSAIEWRVIMGML